MNPADLLVVAVHDASFAGQPRGASQQGSVTLLMGSSKGLTAKEEVPAHIIDWTSAKVHRVVRSTMAAEAASAAAAHDRAQLTRHTVSWLFAGHDTSQHWSVRALSVKYALVADCRSLYDHSKKTSSTTTEKRVALDLAD